MAVNISDYLGTSFSEAYKSKLDYNYPNRIFVDKNSNNASESGELQEPFLTISDAITEAISQVPTDAEPIVIHVASGTYVETSQLEIPSNVHLIGDNAIVEITPTTGDSTFGDSTLVGAVKLLGNNTLKGFTFKRDSYKAMLSMSNSGTEEIEISSCKFIHNVDSNQATSSNIFILKGGKVTFRNNIVEFTDNVSASTTTINSIFRTSGTTTHLYFKNNIVYINTEGEKHNRVFYLRDSKKNIIENNNIAVNRNSTQVNRDDYLVKNYSSEFASVSNNTFRVTNTGETDGSNVFLNERSSFSSLYSSNKIVVDNYETLTVVDNSSSSSAVVGSINNVVQYTPVTLGSIRMSDLYKYHPTDLLKENIEISDYINSQKVESEKVVKVSSNYDMEIDDQVVIIEGASVDLDIKLPDPAEPLKTEFYIYRKSQTEGDVNVKDHTGTITYKVLIEDEQSVKFKLINNDTYIMV